jgi:hypothetical protein
VKDESSVMLPMRDMSREGTDPSPFFFPRC